MLAMRLFIYRLRRVCCLLVLTTVSLLLTAPAALADSQGGQGFYGETSDKVIANAMFITIAFFPIVIIIFSVVQWRLDKRKHARMDAARRRAANVDWRGGW